ncbi:MAG TPA: HAD-IIA family hydrolase [Solirubrobacteraceae bacterium]|nr:HAD-IIA family hydrolase [Solirubrobacteraceae bacterium]
MIDLHGVDGVVFDMDGTLIHRKRGGGYVTIPGAKKALQALRRSGRGVFVFTNAGHIDPAGLSRELAEDGLKVAESEIVTPVVSAISYINERFAGEPVAVFANDLVRGWMRREGVDVVAGPEAEAARVVFVAHPQAFDYEEVEAAARAILSGATFLTGSNVPGYAGHGHFIFSRGGMMNAALSKATGRRPTVVGKPSKAAVRELVRRAGVPSERLAVVGDDVILDIGLGRLGGSLTILVRSGTHGGLDDLARRPPLQRPHHVVDSIADLIPAFSSPHDGP